MRDNQVKFSFRMTEKQANALQKTASQEGISTSQLIRRYVDKGLEMDGYAEQVNFIREQLREEIMLVMRPRLERMLKMNFQNSLYALITAQLCGQALEGLVPPAKQIMLEEAMEKATKVSLSILQNNGIRIDSDILESLWNTE